VGEEQGVEVEVGGGGLGSQWARRGGERRLDMVAMCMAILEQQSHQPSACGEELVRS
jgi:hypothetical protein